MFKDLTGKKFGRRTVLQEAGHNKHGQRLWKCRCDCGTVEVVCVTQFASGDSCGCLRKELSTIDMKGQRFGRWTVMSREGSKWLCLCDCGNTKLLKRQHILHDSRSCGCLNKEVLKRGDNRRTHGMYGTCEWLMWTQARRRARRDGLPYNLELSDIVVPEVCPVLGIALHKDGKVRTYNSPSIDKLIPKLGYVKDNIRVISWRANDLKKNATLGELQKLTAWLEKELENTNATV